MDTYLSELKSNRKKTIKRVAKFISGLAIGGAIIYLLLFSTGCATAYNVSTELREIQIDMPKEVKPQYEKIDYKPVKKGVVFKPTEDGVFINNANVNILVKNVKKLQISNNFLRDNVESRDDIIKLLGGAINYY